MSSLLSEFVQRSASLLLWLTETPTLSSQRERVFYLLSDSL